MDVDEAKALMEIYGAEIKDAKPGEGGIFYINKEGKEIRIENLFGEDERGSKGMEFAKYYDVTSIATKMIANGELDGYTLGRPLLRGVYVCEDTNDFWICRVIEGRNAEYEAVPGKFLVERDKVDIFKVMNTLYEMFGEEMGMEKPECGPGLLTFEEKNRIHDYIDKFTTRNIIRAVLLTDEEFELLQWDSWDRDSLEEVMEDIDGGFGILVA